MEWLALGWLHTFLAFHICQVLEMWNSLLNCVTNVDTIGCFGKHDIKSSLDLNIGPAWLELCLWNLDHLGNEKGVGWLGSGG